MQIQDKNKLTHDKSKPFKNDRGKKNNIHALNSEWQTVKLIWYTKCAIRIEEGRLFRVCHGFFTHRVEIQNFCNRICNWNIFDNLTYFNGIRIFLNVARYC